MTYQAQPGTIPYRAIEHLKALPVGAELSSAELAEAINASLYGFTTCMKPARQAGLVASRTKPGNKLLQFWSLGDGKPLAPPKVDDGEDDELPPKQNWVQQHAPIEVEAIPSGLQPGHEWLERKRAEIRELNKPKPPAFTRHFHAGRFTDGTMRIEAGDAVIVLDAIETTALLALGKI